MILVIRYLQSFMGIYQTYHLRTFLTPTRLSEALKISNRIISESFYSQHACRKRWKFQIESSWSFSNVNTPVGSNGNFKRFRAVLRSTCLHKDMRRKLLINELPCDRNAFEGTRSLKNDWLLSLPVCLPCEVLEFLMLVDRQDVSQAIHECKDTSPFWTENTALSL